MCCIVVLIGLIAPRVAIVLIWLLSNWFSRAFDGFLIPLLGFLFLPYSLLWYTAVMNLYGGEWGVMQMLIMALAVIADISSYGGGSVARRRR
ncbi:MAG: hypothetical protein KBD01_17115 [Acidobacteria bacterium]|nr:hypothetical protein [Acidobacteriota bacterium]